MANERLQKIIARAGLASRRQAEEWITAGRVRVDGRVVRELGMRADPAHSRIQVNGKLLRSPQHRLYYMLHKPRGCVTTLSDPEGRPTVLDFLKKIPARVYPVGRLDYASEGLLLITNDGEFSNHILSSSSGIAKTYWVKVSGLPEAVALQKLRDGISLHGRKTLPARIRRLPPQGRQQSDNPWFEVVLQEGRQNQIRRMFERIGHPVRKLKRVRIGTLPLGNLKPGEFRPLRPDEVRQLLQGSSADE
ncbi:MAG: rRNA pseudouridine synthase [Acidobacteria bacterium]|nr:rRNA pseudouridine synthase [Acidobacteriota bacterium]